MTYSTLDIDTVVKTTDRAVLVEVGGEEYWIPRSVIEDGDELDEGDNGEIEVADWFLRKEGLD